MTTDDYRRCLDVLHEIERQQGNGHVTAATVAATLGLDDIRPVTSAVAKLRHMGYLIIASRKPPHGYRHVIDQHEARQYFDEAEKAIRTQLANLRAMKKSTGQPTIFEELGAVK